MTKHRTEEERVTLCQAWQQSGLTKIEFCKQNNIGEKSFYRWLSKLANGSKTDVVDIDIDTDTGVSKNNIDSSPFKFLQVNTGNAISARGSNSEKALLEISLPNRITFKVSISQDNINNFLQELMKWK